MPKKKYIVELTTEERSKLKEIINADRMAAHKRQHARMLLKIDQGSEGPAWKDADIAVAFDCHHTTVENLRKRLIERGLKAALEHGNRGSYRTRRLDGVSNSPFGRSSGSTSHCPNTS